MNRIKQFMDEQKEIVNGQLVECVDHLQAPKSLKNAMMYSIQAGGKRIRPLLIFSTLKAFHKDVSLGLPAAIAVELIHTYSLIHDDLPAMDDDDFRRGLPTNHKVFGEAVAILAGDGLLTYGFQVIAESKLIHDDKKVALIIELAKAAGPEGMVAGQVADLEGENQELNLEQLEYIHTHKTGKLLSFCVKAGAILADSDYETIQQLENYAHHIGLAFQIRDDILDIEGTAAMIGKDIGSDVNKDKSTYPKLLSLQGAKEKLAYHVNKAEEILEAIPIDTTYLKYITELIGKRNS